MLETENFISGEFVNDELWAMNDEFWNIDRRLYLFPFMNDLQKEFL